MRARATILVVHRSDGVLRAIVRLLVSDGYDVESAESIDALGEAFARSGSAVLVVDEEDAGPGWREQLERVPAHVPRVLLTWYPGAPFPPDVTPLAKPFRARELLETLAEKAASAAPAGLPQPAAE